MSRQVAVVSQKGGVGKTTVALNLAVALAERRKRVLLVDLDPQGAVGLSLARADGEMPGLAELMLGQLTPDRAVVPTKLPGLSLLTRGRLDPADVPAWEGALTRGTMLSSVLAPLSNSFDWILADTPAGMGIPTRAALGWANLALVLVQAEPLALRSIHQVMRVLDHVRATENPRLRLLGLLPTMVDLKQEASRNVMEQVWTGFGGVLETVIPRAEVFVAASQKGLPLAFLGGPLGPEARRFDLLATELEAAADQLGGSHAAVERQQRQLL